MKIYTQTYDLTKASPQRFWVTPFSDFKIGIKLLSKGELANKDFTVKAGAVEITPDEDKIDGFTIFTIKFHSLIILFKRTLRVQICTIEHPSPIFPFFVCNVNPEDFKLLRLDKA